MPCCKACVRMASLSIEELILVPPDFTGYPETVLGAPPVDPAPFNHATKIAALKVKRKNS